MKNGDVVHVMMTSGSLREAGAWVVKATIIDVEHRIVREESGRSRVLEDFERAFDTPSQAWEAAAGELLSLAAGVRSRAEECLAKAAASRIVAVPA